MAIMTKDQRSGAYSSLLAVKMKDLTHCYLPQSCVTKNSGTVQCLAFLLYLFKRSLMSKIEPGKLLFFICTWGYLSINILIAWLPSVASVLLVFRDSWVFLLFYLMLRNSRVISIYLYCCLTLIGLAPLIERSDLPALMTAFYGLRDLSLYFLVGEILLHPNIIKVQNKKILNFIRVVLFLAVSELILNLFGSSMTDSIFNTSNYFSSKGVDSNLSSGLLGDRLSVPFYSSALVCTLISVFYLFQRTKRIGLIEKLIALIIAIFTMSKVLVLTLAFRMTGRYWKTTILFGLVLLLIFVIILPHLMLFVDDPILAYHLASTNHHLKVFQFAFDIGFLDFLPDLIGSHSVAGKNYLGLDFYTIESSLITRILDFGVYSFLFIGYLIYVFINLSDEMEKKFFVFFIFLMSLTATSNHPFIYILFIIYSFGNKSEV